MFLKEKNAISKLDEHIQLKINNIRICIVPFKLKKTAAPNVEIRCSANFIQFLELEIVRLFRARDRELFARLPQFIDDLGTHEVNGNFVEIAVTL